MSSARTERRQTPREDQEALARLEADGLIERDGAGYRTRRRWHGAMMRACLRLGAAGDDGRDLRVPIAAALLELYDDADDATIARLVCAMLPIEAPG